MITMIERYNLVESPTAHRVHGHHRSTFQLDPCYPMFRSNSLNTRDNCSVQFTYSLSILGCGVRVGGPKHLEEMCTVTRSTYKRHIDGTLRLGSNHILESIKKDVFSEYFEAHC